MVGFVKCVSAATAIILLMSGVNGLLLSRRVSLRACCGDIEEQHETEPQIDHVMASQADLALVRLAEVPRDRIAEIPRDRRSQVDYEPAERSEGTADMMVFDPIRTFSSEGLPVLEETAPTAEDFLPVLSDTVEEMEDVAEEKDCPPALSAKSIVRAAVPEEPKWSSRCFCCGRRAAQKAKKDVKEKPKEKDAVMEEGVPSEEDFASNAAVYAA